MAFIAQQIQLKTPVSFMFSQNHNCCITGFVLNAKAYCLTNNILIEREPTIALLPFLLHLLIFNR